MATTFEDVRFISTVLVVLSCGVVNIALWSHFPRWALVAGLPLIGFLLFEYRWFKTFGQQMTRAVRAIFDERNILETYQPRAMTMGHLFEPEPPTPVPGSRSAEEERTFKSQRDAHYANEYNEMLKINEEKRLMESGLIPEKKPVVSESLRVELGSADSSDEEEPMNL